MYKISKIPNKKTISTSQFNSESAKHISREKLHSIINELLDEYLSY
jgi:hypothetical protein